MFVCLFVLFVYFVVVFILRGSEYVCQIPLQPTSLLSFCCCWWWCFSAAGQTVTTLQTTSVLTDLSKACKPGSQLQIMEAYFNHGGNDDECTHSTSCKPTDAGDPSAPCFLDQEGNVCRAKFRFSLQDLNRVYDAVDTGATALKELRDEFSTHGQKYRIRYFCVDVELHEASEDSFTLNAH